MFSLDVIPPPPKKKKNKPPSAYKPNNYKIFVTERCAQTGTPIVLGYEKFKHEWLLVPEETKEEYKIRAKEMWEVEKVERANNPVDKKKQADASKALGNTSCFMVSEMGSKRHPNEEMYYPLGKRYPKQKNHQPSSESSCESVAYCSSSNLISSSTPVPDPNYKAWMEAEGEVYVVRDPDSDMWMHQPDFSEPEVHTEADSLGAIYEYYHTLEDISRLDVPVISCVPAIYASGLKKSAVLPLNRPLELAITTFNLKEGRGIGFIHAFLNPGNLPSLTHADADECRLERHGIPYAKNLAPDDDTVQEFYRTCKVDDDYLDMYTRLLNFLGIRDVANAHKYRLPPVCCPLSELEVNSECIRWLHAKAEQETKKQNMTLILPRLQFASLEAFAQMAVFHRFKSESSAKVFSEDDPLKRTFAAHKYYISLQALNCRFHNVVVSTKACALGSVRASCFAVLAFLFTLYDLPPDRRFLYFGGRWAGEEADSDEELDDG